MIYVLINSNWHAVLGIRICSYVLIHTLRSSHFLQDMFGTFTTAAGQARRQRHWQEVLDLAKQLGLAKQDTSVRQLRHGLYANQTRATRG